VVAVHYRTGAAADESDGPRSGRSCCGVDDARDARAVAAALGVPFYVVDATDDFRVEVIDAFVAAHAAGRTPNPCVDCNRAVKFGRLAEFARGLGADAVATGHYARTAPRPGGGVSLLRGVDPRKDQSYVLYALSPEALARARFPLGASTKDEVRAEARALGLPVSEKPDSQELCFVPGGDHRAVLSERAPGLLSPGPIEDGRGRRVGTHRGAAAFTLGQRRGLGVAAAEPLYVTRVDPAENRVVVGPRREALRTEVEVGALRWIEEDAPAEGEERRRDVLARIRHGQEPTPGTLETRPGGRAIVTFHEPVFAPAPGQALVAYVGDAVLCGGTIEGSA
jgi:tRNA-specific 2-thiouridylase